MNIKFDEDWLNWAVKLEDDASCDIQAGLYYGSEDISTIDRLMVVEAIENEWKEFEESNQD